VRFALHALTGLLRVFMNRYLFTRRGRTALAVLNAAAALFLVACLLVLMLAYFDVLTK